MASVSRIIKVKNPKRGRARATKRKTAAKRKGPAIKRYNVSQLKKELKKRGVKIGGGTRSKSTRRKATAHRRRSTIKRNPVLIELGMLNPKRRTSVAKRKRSTRRKTTARNPRSHSKRVSRVYGAKRRTIRRRTRRAVANPRRRRAIRSRRNPALFGQSGGKSLAMMVGGGLVGVAATKFLPTLIPASIRTSLGTSKLMSVLVTGAGAFAASMIAKKVVGQVFGEAVLFGGLMQTGSVALSAFAPPALASQLALSGIGEIVPGNYVVPQNPFYPGRNGPQPVAVAAPAGIGAMRRTGNYRA